jgi:hypothetical protein
MGRRRVNYWFKSEILRGKSGNQEFGEGHSSFAIRNLSFPFPKMLRAGKEYRTRPFCPCFALDGFTSVPPGVNPNNMINQWSQPDLSNNTYNFALTWRPASLGGQYDYKTKVSPVYDAYGNFEYGATGQFPDGTLTTMGDILHGGTKNPINTQDIQSGSRGPAFAIKLKSHHKA